MKRTSAAVAVALLFALLAVPSPESLASDSPRPLVDEGNVYLEKGEINTAINYYTRAIKVKHRYAPAWYNRGLAWFMKGRYDKAIRDYTQAIKLSPGYTSAWYNRGNAYMKSGRHEAAVADFTNALRLRPDLADAYNNRGYLYLEKFEKVTEACADFNRACELGDCRNLRSLMEVGVCVDGHGE